MERVPLSSCANNPEHLHREKVDAFTTQFNGIEITVQCCRECEEVVRATSENSLDFGLSIGCDTEKIIDTELVLSPAKKEE